MSRLLITGTEVVSMDPGIGRIADADILVVDGRIEAIGPNLNVGDAEVIDGAGTIAIPGFIDTHRHTWEAVIRGMLSSGTIAEYFGAVLLGVGPSIRPEDVYAGTLLGSYEALNAGVTTIVDWCNATNTPEHADGGIRALQEAGIRSMFAYGPPSALEYLINTTLSHPIDAKRVKQEYFASSDQLLTFALGLRGPIGLSPEANRQDFALARELDARITAHAGMRLMPGMPNGEVRILQQEGLLGPDLTIVHGNETDHEELQMLADVGATVSVAPYVELVMGHGLPPFHRLLEHGLEPSLSMDCACTSPGDMFTQMRTTLAYAHSSQLPADRADGFKPEMTAEDVLRFATLNGAKACGLDHRTGSLTVGKDADIVLIRSDAINTMPSLDAVATVTTQADVSNVDTVLVAGKVVKRDGKLVGVNMSRLRELGRASSEHAMASAARAAAAAAEQ